MVHGLTVKPEYVDPVIDVPEVFAAKLVAKIAYLQMITSSAGLQLILQIIVVSTMILAIAVYFKKSLLQR